LSPAAELITTGFPADPVLDIALSHALLTDVASGRRPPALRVFRPGPTAAFGRLDALLPGFDRACAAAREHGLTPALRSVGGHAAVFDQRCVVVERVTREADATAGLQARFEDQSARVRSALASLGADARIGELSGEYCAGPHSVNVGGRAKIAGIAQRMVRGGAATSAIVVAGGGSELRAAVADVYGALQLPVDVATAGALDEELPGVGVEDVRGALLDAYADVAFEPGEMDAGLLGAARSLLPRHRVPVRSRT
jgi:octanoyl-[GcvH]:protein N-octanoyltransferase